MTQPLFTVMPNTTLPEVQKQLILAHLELYNGDKVKTAKACGLSLKTIYNKLAEYKAEL